MGEKIRKSGIDILGDVPWGTHFCQFYKTIEDLIDILVPYFKAGLEHNEFCMWVTSEPLSKKEAKKAMTIAVPNFDQYLKRGQIEIVPHEEWYLKEGTFILQRVLNAWIDKLDQALAQGYNGIRVTGNTAWLEKRDCFRNFTEYEKEVNKVISKYRMIAICPYFLDKCGASEVLDVLSNHQFALIRREGKWELIESSDRKLADETLRKKEAFNFALFQYNPIQTIIADRKGRVIKANMAKKKSGDRLPNIGDVMYEDYARKHEIDMHAELMKCIRSRKAKRFPELIYGDKFLDITIAPFSDGAIITSQDITEHKQAEERLKQHQRMLEASEKELKNFSRKILSIREEEKKNLSSILHDEVGSTSVALSSGLTALEEEIKNNNLKDALKTIAKSKSMLRKSVSRLKKIAIDLRPPNLDVIGLAGACREYFSYVTKQADLKINFHVDMENEKLNDNVTIVLYRIVQEALNNIIKHAKANKVKVTLYYWGNKIKLKVRDNGKGFDIEKSLKGAKVTMGIRGMREMVESLDGTFNIKSAPGKGTEINVTLSNINKHIS